MIVIVDYGMGNVGSILNMMKKIGAAACVSRDHAVIAAAEKIVLPGVGAFDTGMKNLADMGLVDVLNERVLQHKTPLLGVCLGMQLLTASSEEGRLPGLGWVRGRTVRFKFEAEEHRTLKVPHMGWNLASPQTHMGIFHDCADESRFYFVHSYHVVMDDPAEVLSTTHYGYDFCSALHSGNIWGTQFHPEKSHRFGITLFRNFAEQCTPVQKH